MGKRRIIKKKAFRLLLGDKSAEKALEESLKGRYYRKDVIALFEIFRFGIGKSKQYPNLFLNGSFKLLAVIGKIATTVDAPAIVGILRNPQIYTWEDRTFRMLVLAILNRIGTPDTIEVLDNARSCFAKIDYSTRAVGCCRGGGRHIITGDQLREWDRRLIDETIHTIKMRYGMA